MKLVIASVVFILLVMPHVNATPSQIDNSNTVAQAEVPTEVVQPSIPSEAPTPAAQPVVETEVKSIPTITGTHEDWLAAAGIPPSEWAAVDAIFVPESNWRLDAVNPIGCIGLGQNCPDKNGYLWLVAACPNWQVDPVCQIRAFNNYAQTCTVARHYCGWWGALTFRRSHGWW